MIGALLGGAAALGGLLQYKGASKAASAAKQASANELAFQREIFDTIQQQGQAPLEARDIALAQYMAELGLPPIQAAMPGQPQQPQEVAAQPLSGFPGLIQRAQGQGQPAPAATPMQMYSPTVQNQLTPYENFEVSEAIKAAQMATGGKLGGRSLRAISERAQNIAGQSRENRLNRLANLAQLTAGINQNTQAGLMQTGGQIGGAMQNYGAARSSGYIGKANALMGVTNNLATLGAYYGGFNQPQYTGAIGGTAGYNPAMPEYLQFGR